MTLSTRFKLKTFSCYSILIWICLILDEVCFTESVIFLFITVKLLLNYLYCIKHYINKGDMTFFTRNCQTLLLVFYFIFLAYSVNFSPNMILKSSIT